MHSHFNRPSANPGPRISLLGMAAWQRLLLACTVLTGLWLLVFWALKEAA